MARLSTGWRIATLAVMVAGAGIVAVGLGGGVVPLVAAVIVVVLLVTQWSGLFGSLSRGEHAPLSHAVVQGWWAPIAALVGLMMIVGGIATVFEAENLGGRIVGSTALMAFGVVMAFGLMRRPLDRTGGNTLILLATIPALAFFWMIVPPLAAVLIWIGVLRGGHEPAAPAVT